MTVSKTSKTAAIFGLCVLALAGCDSIQEYSKQSERLAYRANFRQIPLVATSSNPNRTLRMHVFTGAPGSVPRASEEVRFHATLEP